MNLKPSRGALLVFLVFSVLALGGFVGARHVVGQEENRLLAERTAEAGAELTSSVAGIDAGLHSLGNLAPLTQASAVFPAAAAPLVTGLVRTVALVTRQGSGYATVALVGDTTSLAPPLSRERTTLIERAFTQPDMVAAVLQDGYRRRIGFALALPPDLGNLVMYQEDAIDPSDPVLSPTNAGLSDLAISLFATDPPSSATMVVSTGAGGARGASNTYHLQVGGDRWALVGQATSPLTGSFPQFVPWLVLIGVLLSGGLTAAVLEILARRRDYAVALVDQRTSELRESQEQLLESERLAAVGLMAASVGHELRNPMAVLSNCLYLIHQRVTRDGMSDERLDRQLATANRELTTANLIVTDLVDWSKELPPNPQSVDVVGLVDEILDSSPPPSGARLIWQPPEPLPLAYCDREHLKHTILNLITNAYDALPDGQGTVELAVATDGGRVTVRVSDDGSGISADARSRLFEPFFTTKVRGIGLGLAVTKRLVTANDGTIDVESPPGAGTTFRVVMPAGHAVPVA